MILTCEVESKNGNSVRHRKAVEERARPGREAVVRIERSTIGFHCCLQRIIQTNTQTRQDVSGRPRQNCSRTAQEVGKDQGEEEKQVKTNLLSVALMAFQG